MRPLVVLPTYNERENLPLIVSRLLHVPDLRVLVVDDQSPDGTGAVADSLAAESAGRVSVMHRTGTRGLGLSYIDGLRAALQTDAAQICQMDADLSHNPSDVPRLLAGLNEADLVIGSRYVPGGRIENWPTRRVLLSAFANRYVRLLTGLRVRDCTSGFRCWQRQALERVPLDRVRTDGYAFLVELVWEAHRTGCVIAEVPITFVERRQGASKMSWRVVVESAIFPWQTLFR